MKINTLVLSTLACLVVAAPCFADGGGVKGLAGAGTAFFVDVPEGIIVDSAYKCPVKATKSLAEAFGDEKGWKQNIVGAFIGIPCGAVFGVPYGAICGGHHALTVGREKPFSKESFVVSNNGD
jgi:hypothetical protein